MVSIFKSVSKMKTWNTAMREAQLKHCKNIAKTTTGKSKVPFLTHFEESTVVHAFDKGRGASELTEELFLAM